MSYEIFYLIPPRIESALRVVRAAKSSSCIPRKSARNRAVWTRNAGSLGLPRIGTGARNGESVSMRRRHYARDGNVEPEVEKSAAKRWRAGEAVDYPLRRNLAQDAECIVVRVAGMYDDGETKYVREVELPREKFALGITRLGRIVVVEPYLPYGGDAGVVERGEILPRLVAIPADCAVLEALRSRVQGFAPADGHYARHPSGLGTLNSRGRFAARPLEVGVCIEKLDQLGTAFAARSAKAVLSRGWTSFISPRPAAKVSTKIAPVSSQTCFCTARYCSHGRFIFGRPIMMNG